MGIYCPAVDHADDLQLGPGDADRTADHVRRTEELLRQRERDHDDTRPARVVLGGPRAARDERYAEHREEVRGRPPRIGEERLEVRALWFDRGVTTRHHRLPIGTA